MTNSPTDLQNQPKKRNLTPEETATYRVAAQKRAHMLLSLGFEPLPFQPGHKYPPYGWGRNSPKSKGGPGKTITTEWLDSKFPARARKPNIMCGVRTGKIVAVDFDINDADILDEIVVTIQKAGVPLSDFIRIGRAPRELWVFRARKAFPKRMTKTYMPADETPETAKRDKKTYQVEILGDGQQFVAYGLHPATGRDYYWGHYDGEGSFVETEGIAGLSNIKDLPEISEDQALRIVEIAEDVMKARGLIVCPGQQTKNVGKTASKQPGYAWDEEHRRFYGMSWEDILDGCRPGDTHDRLLVVTGSMVANGRCDDDIRHTVEPHLGAGNDRRSWDSIHSQMVEPARKKYGKADRPPLEVSHTDYSVPENVVAAMSKAMAPASGDKPFAASVPGEAIDAPEHDIQFVGLPADMPTRPDALELVPAQEEGDRLNSTWYDLNRRIMSWRYAFFEEDRTVGDLTCIGAQGWRTRGDSLRDSLRKFYYHEVNGNDMVIERQIFDYWLKGDHRIAVKAPIFAPDRPFGIIEKQGGKYLNTFRLPRLPVSGDPEPGFRFIRTLLDDNADQYNFFLTWLAYKLQNPATRGPSCVIVAADESGRQLTGTGRGSLIRLIRAMVGPEYMREVDIATLTGKTYQSQYTDWMLGALFCTVNEVKDSPDSWSWAGQHAAAEVMKTLLDPVETRLNIIRKRLNSFFGDVYLSTLICTNHTNALPIDADDRRLWVARTRTTSMAPEESSALHSWIDNPANVGAFRHALMKLSTDGYSHTHRPPMTPAKLHMIGRTHDDLDDSLNALFAEAPGFILTFPMAERFVNKWCAENGVELSERQRTALKHRFNDRLAPLGAVVKFQGKSVRPRCIGRPEDWDGAAPAEIVADLEKNADFVGLNQGPTPLK